MAKGNTAKRIGIEDFSVSPDDRPGWVLGSKRALVAGEPVYCAGGAGTLAAVLGKTGDGSRLLQIQLPDPKAKPFFAAASNVLVAPKKPRRR
ncbi:MAG TPA: hypothetical protein VFI96_03010 [Longimicrobiaceae bacterium]|nr:hypothetical protein [Longimicrobiaceae bacterium]